MRNGHFFVIFDSKFTHMCSENVMVDRATEKEGVEIKGNSDVPAPLFLSTISHIDFFSQKLYNASKSGGENMKMTHEEAYDLEQIVCNIFNCERWGVGNLVSADLFEDQPYIAFVLCAARLYDGTNDDILRQFHQKWADVFSYPKENLNCSSEDFLTDFKETINTLTSR